jgi:catechol 2,3-dioxygenase
MPIAQTAASTQAAAVTPRRLGHVNLWVDDIDRSKAFYHNTCGLMVEFTEPDLQAAFLGVGHTAHDLGMMKTTQGKDRYGRDGTLQIPGTVGLKAGLNHMAWEFENEAELVAAYRNMQRAGVKHDLTMDHQVAHSIYLFDPDGNYNEFYCDTIKDWRSVLHGEMSLISANWDPEKAEGFSDSRYPVDPVLKTNDLAPLHPKRITHLVVETENLPEMLAFYTDIAGLHVASRTERVVYLRGSENSYRFGLVLVEGRTSQYRYASFELENLASFNQAVADLNKRKISIEKILDVPWKRSLFLRDPDHLLTEWYVRQPSSREPDTIDDELFAYAV